MKKDSATPDMFSAAPEKPKPVKESPVIRHKGTYTTPQMIGGIPTYIDRMLEAADCISSRCDSAIRTKTLTAAQNKKLTAIAAEVSAWLPELHRIRKDVDGMVSEVVHGKPAAPSATKLPPSGIRATGGKSEPELI